MRQRTCFWKLSSHRLAVFFACGSGAEYNAVSASSTWGMVAFIVKETSISESSLKAAFYVHSPPVTLVRDFILLPNWAVRILSTCAHHCPASVRHINTAFVSTQRS